MGEGNARQPLQPGHANMEKIELQPCSVSGREEFTFCLEALPSVWGRGWKMRNSCGLIVHKAPPVFLGYAAGRNSCFVPVKARKPRGHFGYLGTSDRLRAGVKSGTPWPLVLNKF